MMSLAFLYSPAFGYLCLLLWDIQPIADMETSSGANVSRPPPTVMTVTRGEIIDLPCRLPREWITPARVRWYRSPGPAGARNETYGRVEGAADISLSSSDRPSRFFMRRWDSLRIVPVVVEDEGVYFCVVTEEQNQFWGNGTELRVLAMETNDGENISWPPPTVVTVPRGVRVDLPCRLPRYRIQVQWYRTPDSAGARNETYGRVEGAAAIDIVSNKFSSRFISTSYSQMWFSTDYGTTLQIAPVLVEDVGVYFCVATVGQKQFWGNGTELRVLARETRIMQHGHDRPPSVTAFEEESVFLPCRLPREWITQNYRVQWYRTLNVQMEMIPIPGRRSLAEDKASLRIRSVSKEDEGRYNCVINVRGIRIIGDGTELYVMARKLSGMMNYRYHPPTVVTVTRGVNVVLPCRVPREWITQNDGVQWYYRFQPISSPTLGPRFSYAPSASLRIEPVALEDEGEYFCAVTFREKQFWGNRTKLRVLAPSSAPPSAPQLFLQAPPDLWSGHWNLFCVTRGFHPNQVRLSWTQNGAESELRDCTPESADPDPVQSKGSVWQNLILKDDCPSNGWLPVSLEMEAKPHPHQRCIYMNDSSGRGPYLVSVLPLSLVPTVGVTYTCAVHDHPALPTTQSASLIWEPPSSEVIRRLNIIKICFISVVTLAFAVAALNSQFKKRAMSPLTQKATFRERNRNLRRPLRSRRNILNTQNA